MASNSTALIIPPPTNAAALVTTNDIRAIRPPVEIRSPWEVALWIGLALAVLGAVAAALWFLRKRRAPAAVEVVPPHVRAMRKLNAALQLLQDPRSFCIAVSDALRVYLEERFSLRAPERTTEEFLRDLQATPSLNAEQKLALADFLERCDLAKFARFEPDESALRQLHDAATRMVHETQFSASREEPAEATPAASAP